MPMMPRLVNDQKKKPNLWYVISFSFTSNILF